MPFKHKTVLIVGASGGLGTAIAQAFAAQGASLALAARRELDVTGIVPQAAISTHQTDLTDPASLERLRDAVLATHGRVDVVINAAGFDVRKPLETHTPDDFRRTLEVNLLGAMQLTQAFLPAMQDGVILHLGGFADGRMAFPFYSADAASRAGLRTFIEAVNRELALSGRQVVVSFFSPSPADTPAERPFHPLWRQMGTQIVPPDAVAKAIIQAVLQRKKVYIMGGWLTRVFAALNAVAPGLADTLLMNGYGKIMARFFRGQDDSDGNGPTAAGGKSSLGRSLGIFLVMLSFLAYGLLLALPWVPLPTSGKLLLSPVMIIVGEATFWLGGALLGKEVVVRYKKYLNPRNWCSNG